MIFILSKIKTVILLSKFKGGTFIGELKYKKKRRKKRKLTKKINKRIRKKRINKIKNKKIKTKQPSIKSVCNKANNNLV